MCAPAHEAPKQAPNPQQAFCGWPRPHVPRHESRFVNFYANNEDIRFLDEQDTALNDGDEVSIIPGDLQNWVMAEKIAVILASS